MSTKRRYREQAIPRLDDLYDELQEEGVDRDRIQLVQYVIGWRAILDGNRRGLWRTPEECLRQLLNEVQLHGGDPAQHERRRSCLSKTPYRTREHCLDVMHELVYERQQLRAYQCDYCHDWHLTSRREADDAA